MNLKMNINWDITWKINWNMICAIIALLQLIFTK